MTSSFIVRAREEEMGEIYTLKIGLSWLMPNNKGAGHTACMLSFYA